MSGLKTTSVFIIYGMLTFKSLVDPGSGVAVREAAAGEPDAAAADFRSVRTHTGKDSPVPGQ